jgi:hypothetical protein
VNYYQHSEAAGLQTNIPEQTGVQDDREEIRTVNVYLEQERAACS